MGYCDIRFNGVKNEGKSLAERKLPGKEDDVCRIFTKVTTNLLESEVFDELK